MAQSRPCLPLKNSGVRPDWKWLRRRVSRLQEYQLCSSMMDLNWIRSRKSSGTRNLYRVLGEYWESSVWPNRYLTRLDAYFYHIFLTQLTGLHKWCILLLCDDTSISETQLLGLPRRRQKLNLSENLSVMYCYSFSFGFIFHYIFICFREVHLEQLGRWTLSLKSLCRS